MSFSATIARPLRSKRAITSPVRRRSNASGLTRISVGPSAPPTGSAQTGAAGRSRGRAVGLRARPGAPKAAAVAAADRFHADAAVACGVAAAVVGALAGPGRPPPRSTGTSSKSDRAAGGSRRTAPSVAGGSSGTAGTSSRSRCRSTGSADARCWRAAPARPRSRAPARARRRGTPAVARSGRRSSRRMGTATPPWRTRPASDRRSGGRVTPRPVDESEPDHHEEQQQQVDRKIHPAVFYAEQGYGAHLNARVYWRRLQEEPTERIADPEEHENHGGDDNGHQADHRSEARSVAVHVAEW